jgi:2-oxo-4-hydroxy-4-carboxy-5-ureidoimidazoline decarboxylase
MLSLAQLNAMNRAQFTEQLGGIFEHSPWIAERSWAARPFADVASLHAAMSAVLAQAGDAAQLALIRAHPQLASKAAVRGELTTASNAEQGGAGLRDCSPEEFALLGQLNQTYQQRFGFPYILAVRGHSRASIIANLQARIDKDRTQEFAEALRQIERIAALRLADLISAPAALS